MAFLVQDDAGSVDGANAYVDAAFFTAYHGDRGNSFTATTQQIEEALVRATDHLDYSFTFVGERARTEQRTQWPRIDAEDRNRRVRSGVPEEVKEACADYALVALSQELNPDPSRDDTGQAVTSTSEQVGPIQESKSFAAGGAFRLPKYPKADFKLKSSGLALSGRVLRRA